MRYELIGTPPEADDHAEIRRDFEAFVRELEATPGRKVLVVFGFGWGNEIYKHAAKWFAFELTGPELWARLADAEARGLGAIGDDELSITLPESGVERRYCQEGDVHLQSDDASCLEAQRRLWLALGWNVRLRPSP